MVFLIDVFVLRDHYLLQVISLNHLLLHILHYSISNPIVLRFVIWELKQLVILDLPDHAVWILFGLKDLIVSLCD